MTFREFFQINPLDYDIFLTLLAIAFIIALAGFVYVIRLICKELD